MQFDWTTFALEIVNFLVLVWLLTRFVYRPVADVLARRRAEVERQMAEARDAQAKAAALRAQYENRIADWEKEKDSARAQLREELDAARARGAADLREALDAERKRRAALDARDSAQRVREMEEQALHQGAGFASRLLGGLAGPELDARIADTAIAALGALPAERRAALHAAAAAGAPAIVSSAHGLSEPRRKQVAAALAAAAGAGVACEFREDETLLAGLRVELGPWVLGANLREELAAFAESGNAHD